MFAKKSLGQNFLKSKEALRAMIEAGDVSAEDTILEVGPGKGVLTEELVKRAKKVIAVEKDDRLIELLQEKFINEIENGKLELVRGDILDFDTTTPPRRLGTPPFQGGENSYKIIANIPYYITGTFLQKFLESENQPTKMVVMVQKEVAQRIVARDGKESILSISVKAYGNPKYIMTVKSKYFSPEPNVDSAIILIDDISNDFFTATKQTLSLTQSELLNTQGSVSSHNLALEKNAPESLASPRALTKGHFSEEPISSEQFFKIVKQGFAHKRKMLVGNLGEFFSREKILEAFQKIGINEKIRAENLTLENWRELIIALNKSATRIT